VLLLVWISLATTWAAPTAEELQQAWASTASEIWFQPSLSESDWEHLAQGKTIHRRDHMKGPDRVIGARWTPATRDQLWIAMQDAKHFEITKGYVEEDFPGSTFNQRTLYQRIALPWPFSERQWVINVHNNRALLSQTQNQVWERSWVSSDTRGAQAERDDAVWVDQIEGGWILADMGEGNLIVYYTRASVGGNIPDGAAAQWALSTVNSLVETVDSRAREEVDAHFVVGHAPIERPDGSHILPR